MFNHDRRWGRFADHDGFCRQRLGNGHGLHCLDNLRADTRLLESYEIARREGCCQTMCTNVVGNQVVSNLGLGHGQHFGNRDGTGDNLASELGFDESPVTSFVFINIRTDGSARQSADPSANGGAGARITGSASDDCTRAGS